MVIDRDFFYRDKICRWCNLKDKVFKILSSTTNPYGVRRLVWGKGGGVSVTGTDTENFSETKL